MMKFLWIFVHKIILISKIMKKRNAALMKLTAHLKYGEAGADAIKIVEVVLKKDIESVRRIHAAALMLRNVCATHDDVSLNGHLGPLLVNARRQDFQYLNNIEINKSSHVLIKIVEFKAYYFIYSIYKNSIFLSHLSNVYQLITTDQIENKILNLLKTCGDGKMAYTRSCPGYCIGGQAYKLESCRLRDCYGWSSKFHFLINVINTGISVNLIHALLVILT